MSAAVATHCFACGSRDLVPFWRVDSVPTHCVLLMRTRQEALEYPRGDLEIAGCRACGFVENLRFEPEVHEYSPRCEESQAFSPTFNRFALELCDDYLRRYRPQSVLEIGCGKGDFLALICERGGCEGIGID
ncbi:MAG: class I SAM-dependent methyltransferase, partial [Planctomycetes bacterium]|nr:class I SAM-dependent methyltransferase [Planctomycetota bacterium]